MQAGTPVVCSDGAGAHDLIENGVNGFVVPSEDAGSLSDVIRRVDALSAKERDDIGQRGKKIVHEQLRPRRVARERLKQYEGVQKQVRPLKEKAWLAEAVRPTKAFEVESDPLRFLDRLPLSALVKYTGRRIWKKIIKRW
jgi:hypothetical protein